MTKRLRPSVTTLTHLNRYWRRTKKCFRFGEVKYAKSMEDECAQFHSEQTDRTNDFFQKKLICANND